MTADHNLRPVSAAAMPGFSLNALFSGRDVPRIPDDMLADLHWMADTPHAIVTMPKPVLLVLLAVYAQARGEQP